MTTPFDGRRSMHPSALLTDLYQLTMLQAYFDRQTNDQAVFEFFVRSLSDQRNFLVAAGLEDLVAYLETLRFAPEELDALGQQGFRSDFLQWLARFRFTGEVHALPEGTIFFPQEPVVRIVAPLPEAQFVESRLINLLQYQILVASKAARCVLAAPGRQLIDFGMRRAHGAEAALFAARASYLAGFQGTSNVQAGLQYGIDTFGTMAHSYILAHDDESTAFVDFARSNPGSAVFLIDTYDTEQGARRVVEIAPRLQADNIPIQAVRLDSGDLAEHARRVRQILDRGGLSHVRIVASGNLDEWKVRALLEAGAPIDGFGIGSRLDVSADLPYLECAYKLQEYAGRPRRKRSEGKATWPGRKQVFRTIENGVLGQDVIALDGDRPAGEPLLQVVMKSGLRVAGPIPLSKIREHTLAQLALLPPELKKLEKAPERQPVIAPSVQALAREADQLAR